MKKVKILFIIIVILITCTGCDVEYNLNITKNNIEETINVTDYITSNRSEVDILNNYNKWYPTFVNFIKDGESIEIKDFNKKVDKIEYHDKTIKEIDNGYKYTYKYNYKIDEYYDSYILASVFPKTEIYEKKGNLVIRTSKKNFLCSYDYYDSVTINITIDPNEYKLNYTNTNTINDNTYTWYLNKDNCNEGEIVLTLNKNKSSNTSTNNIYENNSENNTTDKTNKNDKNIEENKMNNTSDYTLYIFCGILLILILVGYYIFNKIKNKNNNWNEDV